MKTKIISPISQGGAAVVRFSFPTFTDCNFTGNWADGGGGMAPAAGGAVLLFLSRSDDAVDDGNPPTFVSNVIWGGAYSFVACLSRMTIHCETKEGV